MSKAVGAALYAVGIGFGFGYLGGAQFVHDRAETYPLLIAGVLMGSLIASVGWGLISGDQR